jgi:hypothetical protein
MNTQNQTPKPLTAKEAIELKQLSDQIFQGAMFMIIEEADRKQPHIQRYEQLLQKKMAYLKYVTACSMLN